MNFTEEARKLWDDVEHLSLKEIEDKIAAALQAVYERGREKERERCEGADDPEERCPRHPEDCVCWQVDTDHPMVKYSKRNQP